MSDPSPSQFYTGLVAELYDPLVGEVARADDYVAFLDRAGTPALELACGSGQPLVDLVARGYVVEGLDSSQDMLDRCRERARRAGVAVTIHQGEMQAFTLPRSYRAVFLAGASFTLLTNDEDALAALRCIHAHLLPGGSALIPLELSDLAAERRGVGLFRETEAPDGARLRVGLVGLETSPDGRNAHRRLRYERIPAGSDEVEAVERDWIRRSWTREQFRELLVAAGFETIVFVLPEGGRAPADAPAFVAIASKGDAAESVP